MAVVTERFLHSCDSSIDFGVHLDKYRHLSVCSNDDKTLKVKEKTPSNFNRGSFISKYDIVLSY